MNRSPAPRGVSMPTVVFALLLGAAAATALVRELTGRTLDLEAAAPWTLLAAGSLLVVWAFIGLVRQQSRRDDEDVQPTTSDQGAELAEPADQGADRPL